MQTEDNTGIKKSKSLIGSIWRFVKMPLTLSRLPGSSSRNYLAQVVLVIIAFATMVFVSAVFIRNIFVNQLNDHGKAIFDTTYHHVGAFFNNLESAVIGASLSTELLVSRNVPIGTIHEYEKFISQQIDSSRGAGIDEHYFLRGRFYNDINYKGPYCVIRGERIDGPDWTPPENYQYQETQWYKNITEGEGKLVYTDVRKSIRGGGKDVITLGKALFLPDDTTRQSVGVLSIDIDLSRLGDIVSALKKQSESGYAFLVTPHGHIIVHPDHSLIGFHLADVKRPGTNWLAHALHDSSHDPISVYTEGFHRNARIYHYGKLKNDWMVVTVTPGSEYYHQVAYMEMILITLGMLMAMTLCLFLRRLHQEKAQADMRSHAKSMFLARMSHEIRTPMNVIAGLSRFIVRDKDHLPPKIVKYATEICHASDNLLAIINDILDISKVEAGKVEVVDVPFTLSSLLEDIISIIHARAMDKGLQFISFVDSALPNNLIGDVVHIRQILLNILANSVKYTHAGHVAFDIIGAKKDSKLTAISFIIRDTGVGIKEEDQSKVFMDYSQVDAESNWSIEGTGLGLSIVRELVVRLNGSITLVSQIGQGTTFTITLPVGIASEQPCAAVTNPSIHRILVYEPRHIYEQSILRSLKNLKISHTSVQSLSDFNDTLHYDLNITHIMVASFVYNDISKLLDSPNFARIRIVLLCEYFEEHTEAHITSMTLPINAVHVANILNNAFIDDGADSDITSSFKIPAARILVVDDNSSNLLVVEGLLADYECQTDFVTSGEDALRRVQQYEYDLVFMDHMMPGMDGLETTSKIRGLGIKFENYRYLQTLPIVALTANSVFGVKEMFLQNGMNDFLSKPVAPRLLNGILFRWVPKEKQISFTQHNSPKLTAETILIPGVNTRVGIIQTGGTLQGYVRVLETFEREMATKIDAMEKALENNTLPVYQSVAHHYKGFLATIGMMPLSATAAMLEDAARQEDRVTIDIHHGNFIRGLRTTAASVSEVLNLMREKTSSTVVSTQDKDWLLEELTQLKQSIAEMNIQQIDSSMDNLLSKVWTKDITDLLETIMQCITLFEWQKAIGHIDHMLENKSAAKGE